MRRRPRPSYHGRRGRGPDVVRHVDAIGKTDQSLIAITMTGRITNAPSTSGLKVAHLTPSHTEPHRATPRNALISRVSLAVRRAPLCAPLSGSELVFARNLHEITYGFPHFLHLVRSRSVRARDEAARS